LQGPKFFTIDLTKISGRGEIKCPKCGVKISPDDKTEKTYTIIETIMRDESLDKIALQCNKCQSQIYLTGFHLLSQANQLK
jgi:uncharacterized protein with PIN domain